MIAMAVWATPSVNYINIAPESEAAIKCLTEKDTIVVVMSIQLRFMKAEE